MARDKSAKRKKREQRVKEKRRHERERDSAEGVARRGAKAEVYDCRITQTWREPEALVEVLLARRIPNDGRLAVGVFLLDPGCLGLKSAFVTRLLDADYKDLRERMQGGPQERCSPGLARMVIEAAIEYADNLGFKPDPDGHAAMMLFGDTEPEGDRSQVQLGGKDGKPLFISGPNDNARRIIAQLRERCGEDGFNYVLPFEGPETLGLHDIDDEVVIEDIVVDAEFEGVDEPSHG